MKKLFTILLVTSLMLSLTACGGEEPEAVTTEEPPVTSGAVENPPEAEEKPFDSTGTYGNSSGNIMSGGLFVTSLHDNVWIYYSRPGEVALYKMREDGSERTLLAERNAYGLNLMGDYLYYTAYYHPTGTDYIFKYNIKTDVEEALFYDNDGSFHDLTVYEDWIYFARKARTFEDDDGNYTSDHKNFICRIRATDGTGFEFLNNSNSEQMNISGDYIFYIVTMGWTDGITEGEDSYICRMNLDGSEIMRFEYDEDNTDNKINYLLDDGGFIYYNYWNGNKNMMKKMRYDGSDRRLVYESETSVLRPFNTESDWLYYGDYAHIGGDYGLYRVNSFDGTVEFITSDFSRMHRVINDWIYCFDGWDNDVIRVKLDGSERQIVVKHIPSQSEHLNLANEFGYQYTDTDSADYAFGKLLSEEDTPEGFHYRYYDDVICTFYSDKNDEIYLLMLTVTGGNHRPVRGLGIGDTYENVLSNIPIVGEYDGIGDMINISIDGGVTEFMGRQMIFLNDASSELPGTLEFTFDEDDIIVMIRVLINK